MKKAIGSFETSGTNNSATERFKQKDLNHQHQNGGKNYKVTEADSLEVCKAFRMKFLSIRRYAVL
jgi:hypothetical protein